MNVKNLTKSNMNESIKDSINVDNSNVLNSALIKSKRFILNKDNQIKAIKIVSSISSTILLGDLALKVVPIVIPSKLTKLIASQLTVMFPTVINNLKFIPKNNIKKISSNICLLTGFVSIISGNNTGTTSKQESINAFHGFNTEDLL